MKNEAEVKKDSEESVKQHCKKRLSLHEMESYTKKNSRWKKKSYKIWYWLVMKNIYFNWEMRLFLSYNEVPFFCSSSRLWQLLMFIADNSIDHFLKHISPEIFFPMWGREEGAKESSLVGDSCQWNESEAVERSRKEN